MRLAAQFVTFFLIFFINKFNNCNYEDFLPQYLEWYYCYFHSTEKEGEEKT